MLADILKNYGALLGGTLIAAALLFNHFFDKSGPAPDAQFNTVKAAKAYKSELTTSYSESYLDAAKSVRLGKKLGEVQDQLKADVKARIEKAFVNRFSPIVPLLPKEGTDPVSPEQREYMAKFLDDVGTGLK